MSVTRICNYDDLPSWVNKLNLSNNGSGAARASYLVIEDGEYRACYSDAMEPEDVSFHRDLQWVEYEIERARGLNR